MKIAKLELENVKRVRAVEMEPVQNGLSVIGGRNRQGKTSVLDAIAWAVGGEKFRPSQAQREGSMLPPKIHIVMDNGIVVDRDGKNSSLKVTDPSGKRAGQTLLDEFIDQLALNLPKFMGQTNKEKAATLLRVIGMEQEVKKLEEEESSVYNRRHAIGQIADQKRKHALELPDYPDAPEELVSVSELIEEQQHILLKNAENQKKRARVDEIRGELERSKREIEELMLKAATIERQIAQKNAEHEVLASDLETASKDAQDLVDESTEELENSIREVETINAKVRANMDKEKAMSEAGDMTREYEEMTAQIEEIRRKRTDLLNNANLPLKGLSVEKGELVYKGKAWDCMSSSEQMIVAVSIVRALNPKCGFVLLDKTEQMDVETLAEFNAWMEEQGLQGICTRVSTGEECNIIIEDGMVKKEEKPAKMWKEGEF